jgi:hypothetical protein
MTIEAALQVGQRTLWIEFIVALKLLPLLGVVSKIPLWVNIILQHILEMIIETVSCR